MGKLKKLLKRRDDSGRNRRMAAVVKRDTLKLSKVKSKAVTEQFSNLSTSKNCRENAFCIAKHIANANKYVIGDTCVKNDKGSLVFTDTEVESMEGT